MDAGAHNGPILHRRVRFPPVTRIRSPSLELRAFRSRLNFPRRSCSIGINFRTGYIDENSVVEMRPKRIARHYAKGWLLVDVFSCLPTSYITQVIEATRSDDTSVSAPNTKIFKILRLLRLAKLLRIGRLKKIIKRHEEEFENLLGGAKVLVAGVYGGATSAAPTCALLCPLHCPLLLRKRPCGDLWLGMCCADAVVAMCYIAHIVACFWYFVGGDEPHDDPDLAPQPGWITRQTADVWNVTGDRTQVDILLELPSFPFRFVTPCRLETVIVD